MRLSKFVTKDGKHLRCGYTTGTCATAAAKAAALWLLSGDCPSSVSLVVPAGVPLALDVTAVEWGDDWACCAVQKDSGDDPDVTHGVWVYAKVSRLGASIEIDGGEGVGRVTKPGLDQPVGAAAINSVPRRMIAEVVQEVANACAYAGGLSVVVSIPAGAELAAKTFNPRMGIEGGISVIGTTGIVEPMSDGAVVETTRAELKVRRAAGKRYVVLTPGNYGEGFLRESMGVSEDTVIQCSNFIGDALDMAKEIGFEGMLLAGHLGKLVKLAGGMMNTHSRYGDCRMVLLCAHAARVGLSKEAANALMEAATVDEGIRILDETGVREETMQNILAAICDQLGRRASPMETGVIMFTNTYGMLSQTENVPALLSTIREEER